MTGSVRDAKSAPRAVVLDTNIFVAAAFRPGSYSARLIAAGRRGTLRLVWNNATRSETEAVLRRIPPLSWEEFADLFRVSDAYDDPIDPRAFEGVPDPADRKFAALAAAAGATLVTNDNHLLGSADRCGFVAAQPRALFPL